MPTLEMRKQAQGSRGWTKPHSSGKVSHVGLCTQKTGPLPFGLGSPTTIAHREPSRSENAGGFELFLGGRVPIRCPCTPRASSCRNADEAQRNLGTALLKYQGSLIFLGSLPKLTTRLRWRVNRVKPSE